MVKPRPSNSLHLFQFNTSSLHGEALPLYQYTFHACNPLPYPSILQLTVNKDQSYIIIFNEQNQPDNIENIKVTNSITYTGV